MLGNLLVDYLLADAENFQSSEHSCAISSGGEHHLDTVGVVSSNLTSRTMKLERVFAVRRLFFVVSNQMPPLLKQL